MLIKMKVGWGFLLGFFPLVGRDEGWLGGFLVSLLGWVIGFLVGWIDCGLIVFVVGLLARVFMCYFAYSYHFMSRLLIWDCGFYLWGICFLSRISYT